jgi:hypothetical protein
VTPPARVNVFQAYERDVWPIVFEVELVVHELHGGTPRNPDVLKDWLRAKAGFDTEEQVQAEMDKILALDPTRLVSDLEKATDEAVTPVAEKNISGFKRQNGQLIMEGRQLAACIKKEAISVARAAGKLDDRYGTTGKGVISFGREHIFVEEDILPIWRENGDAVLEHDELHRRFTKTRFGTGITVEEVIYEAVIKATISCDWQFTPKEWATLWLTASKQGFGASRSQGFGKFVVTKWEQIAGADHKNPARVTPRTASRNGNKS